MENNALAQGMVVYRTNKVPRPGRKGLVDHLNPQTMDHEMSMGKGRGKSKGQARGKDRDDDRGKARSDDRGNARDNGDRGSGRRGGNDD